MEIRESPFKLLKYGYECGCMVSEKRIAALEHALKNAEQWRVGMNWALGELDKAKSEIVQLRAKLEKDADEQPD